MEIIILEIAKLYCSLSFDSRKEALKKCDFVPAVKDFLIGLEKYLKAVV